MKTRKNLAEVLNNGGTYGPHAVVKVWSWVTVYKVTYNNNDDDNDNKTTIYKYRRNAAWVTTRAPYK